MPTWSYLNFQDSVSPSMEQLTHFHDHSMIILTLITILTLYMVSASITSKSFNKFMMEGQEIETAWTILPAFMLVFIALPSMKILYMMEESKNCSMTIKVIGNQWFWTYEYSDFNVESQDTFMEESNFLRLLSNSSPMILPINTPIRALVSSTDVIHSWAIPSMGVKADASPGRLNQTFLTIKTIGMYTGQCSEICGANHSFMPFSIISSTPTKFLEHMKA